MPTKKRHPDRSEIIKAALSGRNRISDHIRRCQSCREYSELLSRFKLAGRSPLKQPAGRHIWAIENICLLEESRRPDRVMRGKLAVDSWQTVPQVALRDNTSSLERRLVLQAGTITLGISAEQYQGRWEFVGRVYRDGDVSREFVVQAGRLKIPVQDEGFYHWSSQKPPQTIRLLSPAVQVEFGKVTWSPHVTG